MAIGINRYMVTCEKCGYQWLAHKPKPTKCALCHNSPVGGYVKGKKAVKTNASDIKQ